MADFSGLFDKKRKLGVGAPPSGGKRQGVEPKVAAEVPSGDGSRSKKKKKMRQEQQQQKQQHGQAAQSFAASTTASNAGSSSSLQSKMSAQLAGAQFRYINEQLYTQPSEDAVALFREEPRLYEVYHEGFRSQAARWPQRPVQLIAQWVQATQKASHIIADLGCGDAELAASVPHHVHSFDLVACNEHVTACDIAHVPLADGSVHVAVFCLALMGSNFADFLREAHRLLKPRGLLKIAEVSSRITDAAGWDQLLHAIGFDELDRDSSNTHFVLFTFVKSERPPQHSATLPGVALKACQYKKR
eukprot:CAMPEP_0115853194 /NCGR_PEP_ID=MMETSP0287-20121206/13379_1 /TAXON_ID=412157 /ORGANISM="Chrysochromulina rotalis, Strain UIO044" /LENGTH=301 /DNA_ID=CAMNT_0003307265 /DNA_START=67 /DNA_END=972 /DNA_ORIENTATION=+